MYVVLHNTTHPDNQDPLNKRQTKPRDGPISSCSWSSQTERQEKSNPVEEECHWESRRKTAGQDTFIFQGKKTINPLHTGFSWCYRNINVTQTILGHCLKKSSFHQVLTEESQHENAIISYPQLVSVIKVISCHKVIILQSRGRQHMGDLGQSSPHSNLSSECDSSRKGWNPKFQKATNASTKKFLFLTLKWCRAWNVIYIIGNVSLFLT